MGKRVTAVAACATSVLLASGCAAGGHERHALTERAACVDIRSWLVAAGTRPAAGRSPAALAARLATSDSDAIRQFASALARRAPLGPSTAAGVRLRCAALGVETGPLMKGTTR